MQVIIILNVKQFFTIKICHIFNFAGYCIRPYVTGLQDILKKKFKGIEFSNRIPKITQKVFFQDISTIE